MGPLSFDLRLDLLGDFKEKMERLLSQWGQSVQPGASLQDICIQFFNLNHRLVYAVPRNIEISKEFACPAGYEDGLNLIQKKITLGMPLTAHLSKGVLRDELDMLLNDWGIHHLHLGTVPDSRDDRFIQRHGPVVFVRFTTETAYLITIMEHGNWTNQELVKIMHRNWPESIEHYHIKGSLGLAQKVSNDDFKVLRGKNKKGVGGHIQSFVEVEPGVVYAPIGMGYATSGTSVAVMMQVDDCLGNLRHYESYVRENITWYANQIYKDKGSYPDKLTFLLATDFRNASALEIHSRISFSLGPLY